MTGNPDRIVFTRFGQLPSKSNYHHNWKSRKAGLWGKIKDAEMEIGHLALKAWKEAGGTGSMLKKKEGLTPIVKVRCVNQRIDPNNAPKIVCDALEGVCYPNDRTAGSYAAPPKKMKGIDPHIDVMVEWRDGE